MLLGLALFTPLALIGGVFYIMHHIIVKTNLFLVSGIGKLAAPAATLATIRAAGLPLPEVSFAAAALVEIGGGLLLVSQFTLMGETKKGRRPSWANAAPGEAAQPVFDRIANTFVDSFVKRADQRYGKP